MAEYFQKAGDRYAKLVTFSLEWFSQTSWADCQNILSQTRYTGSTTLIYKMDVRSKWILPWFLPALNSCMGSLSGARDYADTGSHCLSRFTSLPLATCLKPVICCRAACCQYAGESRFNICGLLTGMNAIKMFCGCKTSFCINHAIYQFNGPQLSRGTQFNLITTHFHPLFYVSHPDS